MLLSKHFFQDVTFSAGNIALKIMSNPSRQCCLFALFVSSFISLPVHTFEISEWLFVFWYYSLYREYFTMFLLLLMWLLSWFHISLMYNTFPIFLSLFSCKFYIFSRLFSVLIALFIFCRSSWLYKIISLQIIIYLT